MSGADPPPYFNFQEQLLYKSKRENSFIKLSVIFSSPRNTFIVTSSPVLFITEQSLKGMCFQADNLQDKVSLDGKLKKI